MPGGGGGVGEVVFYFQIMFFIKRNIRTLNKNILPAINPVGCFSLHMIFSYVLSKIPRNERQHSLLEGEMSFEC